MLHLLDLNAPDIVTRRNLLIDMIEFCRSSKAEAIALVTAIKKKKAKVHVSSASADADLVNLENKINKLEHQIQQLIGAV